MKFSALLLGLAIAATACGSDAPPPSASPTTIAAPAPAAIAPPPTPSIPRADVDALLTRWLDAQNAHDFDGYAALYAEPFGGVRRTARAELRFDHDGWLDDRRRLFARPMHVEASGVRVLLMPTTAFVYFAQRWESGGYAEEGEKRMVLVRVGDAVRISSEEMLATHTVPAGTATVAEALPAFDTDANTFIVLGEALDGGEGTPRDVPAPHMYVALRDADASIPRAFAALVGARVQLVGHVGLCTATIGSLANVSTVAPDADNEMRWRGLDGGTPATREQIATEVAAMAEHHYWVAIADASTCGRVRGAVVGDRAPRVWPRVQRAETTAAVMALVFAEDARGALIAETRSIERDTRSTDEALEARLRSSLVVHEYGRPGRPTVIQATVLASEQCGGYERRFFFTRTGDAITPHELSEVHDIQSVIDVDDDGTPELVTTSRSGGGWVVRFGATPTTLSEWQLSSFGCGC